LSILRGEPHPKRVEQTAFRALVKAGCGPEELRLIVSHFGEEIRRGEAGAGKLAEIAAFARAIGPQAARDYFRAIAETGAVAVLTGEKLLEFARSVDRHTAEWYFWTIWGTKAVEELTDERVLRAVKFFRSIDSPATVEYFLAIRETKAARQLTKEAVLTFAESIGSEAAVEYFGAFWETKAVEELTDDRVLSFARSIGSDAAKEYFLAIRETKSVAALTDPHLLTVTGALGSLVARDFFRAIRSTKAVTELTDERVLLFAESIGKGPAREYFRVVGSTKAVGPLTSDSLLDTSGVIRSIGSDAALDYFLATAGMKAVPAPSDRDSGPAGPIPGATVPVLTLLDIPTYEGYRYGALLGVSLCFWAYVWQFAGWTLDGLSGVALPAVLLGIWVGILLGAYALLGVISERSANEFLQRRRRLLNEHGIRWHDCLATDKRCELCWSAGHTHEDLRYDYERFCRCPAC
jgi:hypothetical protein